MKTVHAIIGGRVQGVGYRAWVRTEAEARGIGGWVRNCANGDVEAVFQGAAETVDEFCAACWRGPAQAKVDRVDVMQAGAGECAQPGGPRRFEIRF
jgi:acylphosphatase